MEKKLSGADLSVTRFLEISYLLKPRMIELQLSVLVYFLIWLILKIITEWFFK